MPICSQCGFSNEKDVNFCIECGHELKDNTNTDLHVDAEDKSTIEFEIRLKHVVIIIVLIVMGVISYFVYKNIDTIQEKLKGMISTAQESSTLPAGGLQGESDDTESAETSNEIPSVISSTGNTQQVSSKEEIDTLAKNFLLEHYNDIAIHNFGSAYSHYSQEFIQERTQGDFKIKGIFRSLEAFSEDWKGVTKIDITDFQVGSKELNYTYTVTITQSNQVDIYLTDMQLIRKQDGIFQIRGYGSKKQ